MPQLILADKSDLFRRSISSVLQREGYEVTMAETGQKVLALVQTMKPAAIILDTETPDPSGLETLLLLKRDPQLRRLPVILVSRDSAPTAVSNAFKVGAEGFMLKPIDINQLLKALSGLQVPLPRLNETIEVQLAGKTQAGKLRFIDQYGTIYLDKEMTEIEKEAQGIWDPNEGLEPTGAGLAALGTLGTIKFETEKGAIVHQRVLLAAENDQGLAVYPVGDPAASDHPAVLKVPVNYKGRYLMPASFMKLTEVVQVHGEGVVLAGLIEEPKFNSPIQLTVYPPSGGQDGGITLKGKITSTRLGQAGQYECDVQLTEPPGAGYVSLLAEAITGRPFRSGGAS